MNKLLLILIVLSFPILVLSQNKKEKKKKKLPKNIEAIDAKFALAPIYLNEYSFFKIRSRASNDASYMKYKPNVAGSVGGKISIKNFAISYLHALPQADEFGKTKLTNIVFNYQKRVFGLQLFWTNYEGLYIDTLDRYKLFNSMYAKGIDGAFIIRPDIKLHNIGFKNYFIFRKSFSVNAAFEQNERQKETAGSFILMYGANYISVKNNKTQSLILDSQRDFYPRTYDLYKLNSMSFKIAPGLGYSFIMKKYLSFSFIFLAGPNAQFKWYRINNSNIMRLGPWVSFYYEGKAAFGYNGRKIMANIIYSRAQDVLGFYKKYDDKNHNCTTSFSFFREYIKFTLGYRFY